MIQAIENTAQSGARHLIKYQLPTSARAALVADPAAPSIEARALGATPPGGHARCGGRGIAPTPYTFPAKGRV